MGEIVNLRRVRKERDRKARADAAAENRVRHGRTKSDKQKDRIEAEREMRRLDTHQLDGARREDDDAER